MPALGAGFSLIARRPGATLVWGIVNFLLATAPSFLAVWIGGPDLIGMYRGVLAHPETASNLTNGPGLQAMQSLQGLQLLGGLAAMAVVFTAIHRAVLFPQVKTFCSLRFSWAELRTGVIVVVLYVLFIVAIVVGSILLSIPLIGMVIAAGGGLASHLVGVLGMGVVMLLLLTAAIGYPFVRLSMAIPMSLAENRFRLFEAWTLTKGYGWPLFALALLLALGVFVSVAVLFAILLIAAVGAAHGFDAVHFQAFFAQADWVQKSMGWMILIALVYALLATVMMPLVVAPWARAYQLITGGKTEDEHGIFD